jgi:oxygen-independent coproporphyrinogen-3 oxidase
MSDILSSKTQTESLPDLHRQVFRLHTNQMAFACDIADVIRMMRPGSIVIYNDSPTTNAITVNHVQYETNGRWRDELEYISDNSYVSHTAESAKVGSDLLTIKRYQKRAVKTACYELFKRITGRRPPWGSLTGIRPTKLYNDLELTGDPDPVKSLMDTFDIREDKALLLNEICAIQKPYLDVPSNMADIYISVPFCPTKCSYCSFHTDVVPRLESELDGYLSALLYEMDEAKKLMLEQGILVNAIYIGGGTPTSLNEQKLAKLLDSVSKTFSPDQNDGLEYTLEAGRPDTISAEKLDIIKSHGVNRITINPQTMNDETLRLIGRGHTAADTVHAFELARKAGFNNINSDLILALPGETADDIADTLEQMKALKPESLTLHALSLKRASQLTKSEVIDSISQSEADDMNSVGDRGARSMGLKPYYLYRQKNIAGGLENVGYSKEGCVCQYNLDMMEETTSIIALGAGAITKRVDKEQGNAGIPKIRIERVPNMMDYKQYIKRVGDMVQRKRELFTRGAE